MKQAVARYYGKQYHIALRIESVRVDVVVEAWAGSFSRPAGERSTAYHGSLAHRSATTTAVGGVA